MKNEPVAWIDKSKLDDWLHGDCYPDQCFIHYQTNDAIPLYTHPVKELTDEEIGQIYADNLTFMVRTKEDANNLIDCAKAILKRASEK